MTAQRLDHLTGRTFDLVVVGGGVTGACTAWEAATRGLSVCLVEAGDFGGGTSANSLKTIHGGFRYLGQANFARTREAIYERSVWLRVAPHLVTPLPCLIATHGLGTRSRMGFRAALAVYNYMGRQRNQGLHPQRQIPKSRLVSKDQLVDLYPGFQGGGFSGGVMWFDAQAKDTERLVVEVVSAAIQAGAQAANHAPATALLKKGDAVHGVVVNDALTGREYEVAGRMVINAAGPWAERLADPDQPSPAQALGLNLVAGRRLVKTAVGVESFGPGASDPLFGEQRYLFLAPWGECTLLGTSYTVHYPDSNEAPVTAEHLNALLREFQRVCPELELTAEDITHYHHGLLPLDRADKPGGLSEKYLVDQATEGLINLCGVKYTTGRALAVHAVNLAADKLSAQLGPSLTHQTLLPGGDLSAVSGATPEQVPEEVWQRLRAKYGSLAFAVAGYGVAWPMGMEPLTEETEVLGAEVMHAMHREMARKLADVVFRRTGMGSARRPARRALETAASIMAVELGWDQERLFAEVDEVEAAYAPLPLAAESAA